MRNLTTLTHAQRSYLLSGRYLIVGDAQFEDDDEADAAWELHHERILAEWDHPGRRPPAFWALDVGLKCIRWPDQWAWPAGCENEADTIRAMLLAGTIEPCKWDGNNKVTDEVVAIEAEWRDRIRVALSGGHSTAPGVPKWFRAEHTPAVKVEIAADRAAWKRSIGTPASSGSRGSRP